MKRVTPVLVSCLVAGGALAAAAFAQSEPDASEAPLPAAAPPALAAPAPRPPAPAPAAAASSPPAAPPVSRHIDDPEIANALASGLPKYAPPKAPPPPPPTVAEEYPDLRDVDKPRNAIIRLPKYVVHQLPPPVFTERQIHTDTGLTDLAKKRYLSDFDTGVLNQSILPFFGISNEQRAMQMYQEDERLKNISDLNDTANTIRNGGDASQGEYIRRETQDTFMRGIDWGGPVPQH